jgi:PPP family 3-phenylpropionic acid transporter
MPARSFALRSSVFFLFLFFGIGIQLPFLPLWLKDKGLSAPEIAFILAAQIAVRVISAPVGAFIADRTGRRRALIQWGASLCFAGYAILCLVDGFLPVLICLLVAGACFSMIVPLVENFAIEGATHFNLEYGRLRLWGTLSFMAGNIAGGFLLEIVAIAHVVQLIALAQLLLAAGAFWLPSEFGSARTAGAGPAVSMRDALRLFSLPAMVIFFAAVSLGQASHAVYYGFGSVHWTSLGYSEGIVGLLWLTGGLAEVLVFATSGKAARAAGPVLVIVLGTGGGMVRWLVTASDPGLAILFAVQTLHACSFTLTHLGTMLFIQQFIRSELRNTAQGIYAALSGGLVMSIATLAAGPLYRDFGAGAYHVMAAGSAVALCLTIWLRLIIPKDPRMAGTS